MSPPCTWDIFCRVVDNYGDAAVCWRLARQLAAEHEATVRLWIDTLAPLHALCPQVAMGCARQSVAAVEVRVWPQAWETVQPAETVVEAFGCGLPDEYVRAMVEAARPPAWVVLEYLSAEAWVPQHHGLPSPHPRWGIPRYFFFPGFVEGTGGLLREAGLAERRRAFDAEARGRIWHSLGFEAPAERAAVVSIFAYAGVPLESLLSAWEHGEAPVIAGITHGKLAARAGAYLGRGAAVGAGQRLRRGNVEVRVLPFVPQHAYDELLWSSDCNFVRGEDSFVRAQWAALPFVWNIYPQTGDAHWKKLEAFLGLYCAELPQDAASAVKNMWAAWNAGPGKAVDGAWHEFRRHEAILAGHARAWAAHWSEAADLAGNLAQFCAERVKY